MTEKRIRYGKTGIDAVKEVFRYPAYVALAAIISLAAFAFSVLVPNFSLLEAVVGGSGAPLAEKLALVGGLFGSIGTNFSILSASYTIAIALLFGMDIAMIIYFFKRKRMGLPKGTEAASAGGVASGMVGIGCAACGTFIFSTLLSFIGASGAIVLLPLKGEEFGLLSVILLAISVFLIARKITAPIVCDLAPHADDGKGR